MLADDFFHPDHSVPPMKFIAAVPEFAHKPIPQFFMKSHTGVREIGIRDGRISDAGVHIGNMHALQRCFQLIMQPASETLTAGILPG